jgi:hypothetical protein
VRYVRLALVVLSFVAGAGVPLYLAAWILVPEEGSNISSSMAYAGPDRRSALMTEPGTATTFPTSSGRPSPAHGPAGEKPRRARLVLWAAGVIALVGLVGGGSGLVAPHLIAERLRRPWLCRSVGPAPDPTGDGRQPRRGLRGCRPHREADRESRQRCPRGWRR